jgi:hypothetical protein
MDARLTPNGDVLVTLSYPEALALHEALAYGEWSGEFESVSWQDPLFPEVLSRLQGAVSPLISELGTPSYGQAVEKALEVLRQR